MEKHIGTRIMLRRKELGWTQEDLSKKLGYKSKSTINKIELGINDIPQSKVVKFSEALGVSIAYLMGWEDEIKKDPVGTAQIHIEMIMDEDFTEIFEDFKTLDNKKRKIVKDLVKSLVEN